MAGTQVAILQPKDTLRMLRKRDLEHRFVCLKCGLRIPNSHQLLIWRVYIQPPNHGKFPLCAGQEGESHISKGSPGILKITKVARNKYSHKNVLLKVCKM